MPLLRNSLFFLCAFSAAPARAVDHHVPATFGSIQSALNAALDGDRVVVAPGRYYEALRFPARRIHLVASAGPTRTTIDAGQLGTVVTFEGAPGRGTILEGFTITNGLDPDKVKAGGVHIGQGGAPILRGNVIRQNLGYGNGHGVSLFRPGSALIERNEIRHNRVAPDRTGAGGGAGIGIEGSDCLGEPGCAVEIRDNYIANNYATWFGEGGGMRLSGATAAVIGNVIEYNTARYGGGVLSSGSPVLIENNLFHANWAEYYGGGIEMTAGNDQIATRIVNNTFVGNEASTGSAIRTFGFNSQAQIANNIVSAIGIGTALFCEPGFNQTPPQARHNLVYVPQGVAYGGLCANMLGANGNRSAAPAFVDETDFRLQAGSRGVDEGDNSQTSQAIDLAGATRIADGNGDGLETIDIGAYESGTLHVFFADSFESAP